MGWKKVYDSGGREGRKDWRMITNLFERRTAMGEKDRKMGAGGEK